MTFDKFLISLTAKENSANCRLQSETLTPPAPHIYVNPCLLWSLRCLPAGSWKILGEDGILRTEFGTNDDELMMRGIFFWFFLIIWFDSVIIIYYVCSNSLWSRRLKGNWIEFDTFDSSKNNIRMRVPYKLFPNEGGKTWLTEVSI